MKTPSERRRGRLTIAFAAAIALLPGCAADQSSPAAPVNRLSVPSASVISTGAASNDSLLARVEQEKLRIHEEAVRSVPVYDSLHGLWAATHARTSRHHAAATTVLECEPQPYAADVQIIGPDGGLFHVGPHFFWVPKGALAQQTVITVEMPVSTHAELDFAPHGLRFGTSVLLLNYRNCDVEATKTRSIVYTDDAYQILETPPSFDWKSYSMVRAGISHFSHYVVAY